VNHVKPSFLIHEIKTESMKDIQLPSGKYLLVEVSLIAFNFRLGKSEKLKGKMFASCPVTSGFTYELPSGNWQIIGKADSLSEDDWKGIVEPLFSNEEINDGHYHYEIDLNPMPYKNYNWNTEKDDGREFSSFDTSVESGHSLIASHSMKPETTLILKLNP
jgi:hypothetical protein